MEKLVSKQLRKKKKEKKEWKVNTYPQEKKFIFDKLLHYIRKLVERIRKRVLKNAN